MRELFTKYKSVVRFVLTFLSVYIVLSLGYKFYLDFSDGSKYYPDYITHTVAKQSEELLNVFGYESETIPHPDELTIKLTVNNKHIARIIEGCNSVSVIILFVSFIIAFAGRKRTTVMFILAGSVLIYVINLLRIVVISIGLFHYPWRSEILHSVIFPLIIYGTVFLLWMFWVNRFSNLNQK